jgi:hypothetical protein
MIFTLLGLIPGAMSLIQNVTNALYNAKVQITMAQLQCDRDKAVALINERAAATHDRVTALQAIAASSLLTYLVIAFAAPLVIYEWKVIVVDIVFQAGTTDPIRGQVADWATSIIYSIFGGVAGISVASMFAKQGSK